MSRFTLFTCLYLLFISLNVCFTAPCEPTTLDPKVEKECHNVRDEIKWIPEGKQKDALIETVAKERVAKEEKILEMGELRNQKLEESGYRIAVVIRSRQEFLESELFPINYVNPSNRRLRWWIIFKTPGEPRDEFVKVVEDTYRDYTLWKTASLDDILNNFIDFACANYRDISDGTKGPHECDQELLEIIEGDDKLRKNLFKIIDVEYTERNVAGMRAMAKLLTMKTSPHKMPVMSDVADLRCLFIYDALEKQLSKNIMQSTQADIQQIFPLTNVVSVKPVQGSKVQPIVVPGQQNVHVQSKDAIKVEFANCNDAFEALNNNYGFIGKVKIRLIVNSC